MTETLLSRLRETEERYHGLEASMSDPALTSDAEKLRRIMKDYRSLTPVMDAYRAWKQTQERITEALSLLDGGDTELHDLAAEELRDARDAAETAERELTVLLLPRDPRDEKNVMIEIRAGAGGDEAALFAADLYRMYCKYAEQNHWKVDTMNSNENGIGGFKEIVFMINGAGAYSKLKYESGVHRVQRIPATESGGRIHTSTATVAIMPEVEEVEVELDMNDCKFDVFRASGNGGQCVNTTDSAVRLTHIPTGIVISCQDEKSQLKNKDKALKVLRARLYELECAKAHDEEAEKRRSQIGTGDRSEKIRTYNYPQGRVTDHRIKLTLHRLDAIINGDLSEVIDSLIAADQAAKLASMNEE
ncbi:MAG TPA: peptide chain release factor 1 [Lachnospiraceae bacterium]|nr:peptide chain release factor 1 [Lachnospiraceae bacterium]